MAHLLDESLKRQHILVVVGYVLAEAEKNLAAKFPEGLPELTARTRSCTVAVTPRNALRFSDLIPLLPEKDLPVLVSAIEADCDALVTGDKKHFGEVYGRVFQGVRIVSPAMLFEML